MISLGDINIDFLKTEHIRENMRETGRLDFRQIRLLHTPGIK